ncbi:RNA polymerase recycling motor HelD [Oceanirhabdus sp. W0125-5]|uniref:RNA polymerase recycling motor HelD n=1 Tax=Oceanirhabdus sp. W0125-5 TaxID=2999116 RepID=UPI0022F2D3B7|nr:RNA polymerase recycling motor HelD [Oceanirhabdus sp. W0125-5]WBW94853.1 AAA family ATPase [Oceanirhabdus sp. W0125-5]
MELSKNEWKIEEDRLERIKGVINNQLRDTEKSRKKAFNQGMELGKDFWDNDVIAPENSKDLKAIVDITQNIQAVKREQQKVEITSNTLRKLKLLQDNLYFGRIDFEECGVDDKESIYIGSGTLIDDLDILIYDWRSPVCGMFYEYEMGKADYECPEGQIEGDITLKRQYSISDGKIKYMFNTDLKIDDDILQKSLSNNCDENMRTIIKSIQKEQNRVIRNKNEDILIVQGPAGSGKTSIALHRAAYVLYKYRDRGLKSDNIVIFSPNEIFNDYISEVLPELGEDKISQTTFMEYAIGSLRGRYEIEDGYEQMEQILSIEGNKSNKLRKDSIKFKGTLEFQKIISRYIKHLEQNNIKFKDIYFKEWRIITGDELNDLYYNTYGKWPIKYRYKEMVKDIEYRIKKSNIKKLRYEQLEKEFDKENKYCYEGRESISDLLNREMVSFRNYINNLLSIKEIEVYKKLIRDRELFNKMARGIELPVAIREILRRTISNLNSNKIEFEDITPLLYIKHVLGDMKNTTNIKYVIIDEAQDYSPFQYKLFKELYPKAGFTILGDINQSINPYVNTIDYSIISDIFNHKSSNIIELQKSYRSTKEISDFTRRIINNEKILNVSRAGEKPKLIKASNYNEKIKRIKKDIESMVSGGIESIAIICRTAATASKVYRDLKEREVVNINLIKKEDEKFKSGINIVPSYLSKGLEFDSVIIFDGDEHVYSKEEERLLFYTICTRALHKLSIYYKGNPSRFINHIDDDLLMQG